MIDSKRRSQAKSMGLAMAFKSDVVGTLATFLSLGVHLLFELAGVQRCTCIGWDWDGLF